MDTNFLIQNGVDVNSGIELLGDVETYNDTLADFLEEEDTRVSNIEKYMKEEDMENYAILVHAIKGDSKYLGFSKLAELALDHQLKAQDNDLEYVKEHYSELMDEVHRIDDVVKTYLGR